jgi:hypothetical protein
MASGLNPQLVVRKTYVEYLVRIVVAKVVCRDVVGGGNLQPTRGNVGDEAPAELV